MRVSKMLGATMVAGAANPVGPAGYPGKATARAGARSTRVRPDAARGGPRAAAAAAGRRPPPDATWR